MNILEEANKIIYGDREQTYGHPSKNLDAIAMYWSTHIFNKFNVVLDLTAEDVCWMMVDLKKARQLNQHKRDNVVDAAGYIALIERIQEEKPNEQ